MPTKDIVKRHIHQATYYARHKEEIQARRGEYFRKYAQTEVGRIKKLANFYRMIEKYPEKYKARYALRNAVRLGKIEKGVCEVCSSAHTESYHDDYSKPLEVRWLCPLHHRNLKKKEGL